MLKILVVDDDKNSRDIIKLSLENSYEVDVALNGVHALELIRSKSYDVVICDYVMNEIDGIEVLKKLRKIGSNAVFILITAFGSSDIAIKAIQEGAYEYLSKPFKMSKLKQIIQNVEKGLNESKTFNETNKLENDFDDQVIAESSVFLETLKDMARVAISDVPVLITGESGVGKEIVAKSIHRYSKRSKYPFVAVNCNAIPGSLLESELFGYEKGAFTGADKGKPGYFEQAQKGTLFLDEIGDLEFDLQVKLLRVLQEQSIRRVGGIKDIKLDVRFIFATNVDLDKKVQEGKFRADLYYRLKVAEIRVPPLRERKEDIIPLANYFIRKYNTFNREIKLSNKAEKLLLRYDFPGNVRELENIIRASLIKARYTGIILDEDLNIKEEFVKDTITKEDILQVLEKTRNNRKKAAELLGVSRATFYRLLRRYNID
ncbi:two-component system, NtrC family, response regulator AtoC [Deferribacter desulfuricans SSM1]|uniref:Two-component system, NtrC family, response regulator AtoC n=1 Tax=Deferribacter desulfuricans (strain DSM 14783 / JCM 11476 / NBRC 101012 / SSM1) TaxID=639282 RepID=D3PCA8_DEFDS|nr:sigma-54 dependent transcriptional regulator [Deferribacter desulfuricans]BAI80231.1 two-component system, NtrC family, response regulator AtoC [Deferribacter desulfuricans SSM1]